MRKVLVSACLLGSRVRFDGRAKEVSDDTVERWRAEGRIVRHCPEIAGGLPVPRPPAEIEPGAGAADVLAGRARILTPDGRDVTGHFVDGARAALATARSTGAEVAVLKESSPSCGLRQIYDGTFSGTKVPGSGVTAHLLTEHGIAVFTEDELAEADARLRAGEREDAGGRACGDGPPGGLSP
ncbi:DUF523 domain-containing protein [Nocardiopsis sp. HNM0947]|uniref:DUF523 domain-containing protein n=1 Tax=Nocardiopsis coralli TaxID=2772213 RepID=A0ABR9P0B2_9ACTN|nr:DUF523 domain-containing protein [Nocardiopsis coralli]MBE2997254.1 DUF523 domain-containing protein [Nocardiopsis coralli]